MKKTYEVLVKYYEAMRINVEVESEEDIDKEVRERMSEEDVGGEMIIDYDYEEVAEPNPAYDK